MGTVAYPYFRWRLDAERPTKGYPEKLEHLGHHLVKRRLELGLNRKETAKLLKADAASLQNWEYGRTIPADRFMPAVIEFLRYNPLPIPSTQGARVAYERISRGWSRKRLAGKAEVDEATIRRIEQDVPRLARRPLQRICKLFGIELGHLDKTHREPAPM